MVPPTYGNTIQHAKPDDESPTLGPDKKLFVQQVVGSLLYYAMAVDDSVHTLARQLCKVKWDIMGRFMPTNLHGR